MAELYGISFKANSVYLPHPINVLLIFSLKEVENFESKYPEQDVQNEIQEKINPFDNCKTKSKTNDVIIEYDANTKVEPEKNALILKMWNEFDAYYFTYGIKKILIYSEYDCGDKRGFIKYGSHISLCNDTNLENGDDGAFGDLTIISAAKNLTIKQIKPSIKH